MISFSVIIPVYNRAHCIERAVLSVQSQSLKPYEIIIIDDGSIDNTLSVVRELAANDSSVRIVEQKNKGASAARNAGILLAAGSHVAFLDSDDVFLPNHLESCNAILMENFESCVYAPVIVDRGNGITLVKPNRALSVNEHISDYLMSDRGFIPTITLIVPTAVAKAVLYDEKIGKGDDYDFAIRLGAYGCNFSMVTYPTAIWYDAFDENRLSNSNNLLERIEWLNRIKHIITEKAYYSEFGWPIAKYFAEVGDNTQAFKWYFKALFKGCYRPKMAFVIFLQIALSKKYYRYFSDFLAKFGIKP